MAPTIEFDEFLFFIDQYKLMGRSMGFVDVHLLASAKLAGIPLWTADKKLRSTADLKIPAIYKLLWYTAISVAIKLISSQAYLAATR